MSARSEPVSSCGDDTADDIDYKVNETGEEDDERTIEEEEREAGEDEIVETNELDDLQADADLPIDEVLKKYTSSRAASANQQNGQEEHDNGDEGSSFSSFDHDYVGEEEDEDEENTNNNNNNSESNSISYQNLERFFQRRLSGYEEDDDSDIDDQEFEPTLYKMPKVGDEYQIDVKPLVDVSKIEENDALSCGELLWSSAAEEESKENSPMIDQYLQEVTSEHPLSDQEISLKILLSCHMNKNAALIRFRQLPIKTVYAYTPLSDAETINLEEGLREYHKDFYRIRRDYLPNRTAKEVVHFYYVWKQSSRYQQFHSAERDRRQMNVVAYCVNDMIERFLEENQQGGASSSTVSSSTSVEQFFPPSTSTLTASSSLLSADTKRRSPLSLPPSSPSQSSFVTIHQHEMTTTVLKRSFDQIDEDEHETTSSSPKKSARTLPPVTALV